MPSHQEYSSHAPPGVFRSVSVSRQGAFSCPVVSGVLFVARMDVKGHATSDGTMSEAFDVLPCFFTDTLDLNTGPVPIGEQLGI